MSEKKEQNQKSAMPVNRIAGMARNCAQIVIDALAQSLLGHRPADGCLREICRNNHQLGSRDRRVISETLFSVLRWWGWLQKLAPEKFVTAWQNGVAVSDDAWRSATPWPWYSCMSAAWILETRFQLPPAVMFWLREAGLYPELFEHFSADTPVRDRRKFLRPFSRMARCRR